MTEFEEYKMIFEFMHPNERLKMWVTKKNFINKFKYAWDALMDVMHKIVEIEEFDHIVIYPRLIKDKKPACYIDAAMLEGEPQFARSIYEAYATEADDLLEATYKAIVKFLKWYNGRSNSLSETKLS